MNLDALRRLFNVVTRQAVYIEQIKLGETQEFNATLKDIEEEFKKILSKVQYETLDGLSKAQLQAFVRALRVSQTRVYSAYQQRLIDRLNMFMRAAVNQTVRVAAPIYANAQLEEPEEELKPFTFEKSLAVIETAMKAKNNNSLFGFLVLGGAGKAFASLWSKIINTPIPASGALPVDYIKTANAKAMVDLENEVRKAYANRSTKAELLKAVLGSATGSPGVLGRTRNTMAAVLATTVQHVAQQSVNAAYSTLWPEYVWVSIIDSATSDICLSRNLNTYQYGKGPLPPAHPWCRSHIMPFDYWDPNFKIPSWFEWLKVQPYSFLLDLFGATIAGKFKAGTIKATDVPSYKPEKSLSVAEFLAKTSDLL